MDATQVLTVVTSAAVGAFVSAVTTAFGQWRSRVHERKRVIFDRAFEMARLRAELSLRVVEERGGNFLLADPVLDASRYHRFLTELYDKGTVTEAIPPMPVWPIGAEMPSELASAFKDKDGR